VPLGLSIISSFSLTGSLLKAFNLCIGSSGAVVGAASSAA